MNSASYGGFGNVYVVNGSAADWYNGGHISEEMWTSTGSSSFGYWVEVGYAYGPVGGHNGADAKWFWADNRPGGGYHEHVPSNVAEPSTFLNQNVSVATSYAGSNVWNVYIGGTSVGTSTGNPGPSDALQVGLEVYSDSTASYLSPSVDGSLKWQDFLGGWHNYWTSTSTYVDPQVTGGWYIPNFVWTNSS